MGWGDEIMVSSIAKRIHAMTNLPVTVCDENGQPRKHGIWDGLSYILQPPQKGYPDVLVYNGPGMRHYYRGMSGNRILWRKWDIAPGEIRLTDEERQWARQNTPAMPFIVLEPTFKSKGGGGVNKDWGTQRWMDVFQKLRGAGFLCARLGNPLPGGGIGNFYLETPTFRHACAILERSIGYVGHEGGLHHAAAALGKKAVVVFGGYISPEVTGYSFHRNLYTPDERYPLGCGTVAPCEHCREAQAAISVEQVVEAVKEMVNAPAKK